MAATLSTDVTFIPKVWSDHITAFFDRKMALGQLALMDRTLMAQAGETVNFPYFRSIGPVEEPLETASLAVDALVDDAFSVTIKEVGKAVGWRDKAIRKSATGPAEARFMEEAQRQIARVFAEKVDQDIITVINAPGSSAAGYVAAANTEKCTVNRLLQSAITGFGDKQDEAVAIAMHSQDFLSMMTDSNAGFLKADANDPFYQMPGFMGRILGKALFVLDTMPEVAGGIAGRRAWQHFIFKPNPYGIYMAAEMKMEMDRDILTREDIVAATMWYGVLSLHEKVSLDDERIVKGAFVTDLTV
jgi:hypothetical protein